MTARMSTQWCLIVVIGIIFSACVAQAEFVLIEDFEDLLTGPIHEQNGWFAPSDSSIVTEDPYNAGNQVLSVITGSTILSKELLVLDGTVRMLFWRFRFDEQLNYSMGMSDAGFPTRFDHFEAELSQTNSPAELRINDDGTYEVLTFLKPGTWYNCWMLLNNETDETQVWLHALRGQVATDEDLMAAEKESVFEFRNGSAGDLRNFFIKMGGGGGLSGPLYIDDIYLENTNSLNLDNPSAVITSARTSGVPATCVLGPNYPNPFNPVTTIAFDLPRSQMVELSVYTLDGRLVSTLVSETMPAGRNEVVWDGCGQQGNPVASGMYLYRINTGTFSDARCMALIK